MAAIGELREMLGQMEPELRSGAYVFVSVTGAEPHQLDPIMTFLEDEGRTLILTRGAADRAGLSYDVVTAWITLRVHSALDGVGLTAAVSVALADAGISCNVVAAAYHDHLFVPIDRGAEAVAVLERVSAVARRPAGG